MGALQEAQTRSVQIIARQRITQNLDLHAVQSLEPARRLAELRLLDLLEEDKSTTNTNIQPTASAWFDLLRVQSPPKRTRELLKAAIRLACAGVIADRSADVRRELKRWQWERTIDVNESWGGRLFLTLADSFIRTIRKSGWEDLNRVAASVLQLREQQKQMEAGYLEKNGINQSAALELVSLYHIARAVELVAEYSGTGSPADSIDKVDLQYLRSKRASDAGKFSELSSLVRIMRRASSVLIRGSIWYQLRAYNSRVTSFKATLTSKSIANPLFELLPPQKDALKEVMNTSNRAIVVQLPTSGGKTLLAEFRILQTKSNFPDSWIAYVVPTRALVNQITLRLRRDLAPLGLSIEQATPALELDSFEEELLNEARFDVLVTTAEKLDLLLRGGAADHEKHPLGLVVADEAHGISDSARGVRLELLLSTISQEQANTHFLLLTPFIPNAEEVARWLDENRCAAVMPSLSVDWQPNERLVGLVVPEGKSRNWGLQVHSLSTQRTTVKLDDSEWLGAKKKRSIAVSKAKKSKNSIAALAATELRERGGTIVLAYSPNDCWKIAEQIATKLENRDVNPRVELVARFVEAEFGTDFPLASYVRLGLGIHHAGISAEVRYMLEWLTENNDLETLVATSTLAQGVNFPISSVVLATHFKARGSRNFWTKQELGPDEFWNIAGRAGRLDQPELGLVLFAAQHSSDSKIEKFANNSVLSLASALERMVEEVIERGWELDLHRLVRSDVKWSSFVQFLAHAYRQEANHSQFVEDAELLMRRTLGYRRLASTRPEIAEHLLDAVRGYAVNLRKAGPGVTALVDTTGFSPETVSQLLSSKADFELTPEEWSPSNMFRAGGRLDDVVGQLLKVPELQMTTQPGREEEHLAGALRLWVEGKGIRAIADSMFPNEDDPSRRVTECCRLLYQKLSHQASWGVSALQTLSGMKTDLMTEDEKVAARSLPAMLYYGCSSPEAVLMRTLSVPRPIAENMGRQYRSNEAEKNWVRRSRAREWLEKAPMKTWNNARPSGSPLSGADFQNVWRLMNGFEPEIS